jgi:hypothetical protein
VHFSSRASLRSAPATPAVSCAAGPIAPANRRQIAPTTNAKANPAPALRWGDIDWEHDRITVHSVKTEHHEEKASRVIPLFGQLRPYLEEAFDHAEAGTEYVITRYRDILRVPAEAGVRLAGFEPATYGLGNRCSIP